MTKIIPENTLAGSLRQPGLVADSKSLSKIGTLGLWPKARDRSWAPKSVFESGSVSRTCAPLLSGSRALTALSAQKNDNYVADSVETSLTHTTAPT